MSVPAHIISHPLKGLVHGINYGTKIRFPHALVMTFLFKPDMNIVDKLRRILKLTFLHSRNLAAFVCVYKLVIALGRFTYRVGGIKVNAKPGHPAAQWHALLAGAIGGSIVWSNYNAVNYQIVLYLLSRIIIAGLRVLARRGYSPFSHFSFKPTYPWFAAGVWAIVMWLFEYHDSSLHGSLAASMRYLYHESNTLSLSLREFVPTWPALVVLGAAMLESGGDFKRLLDLTKKP